MESKFNINAKKIDVVANDSTVNYSNNKNNENKKEMEAIEKLISELIKQIPEEITINNIEKEKFKNAINTTKEQLESNNKNMLEVCVGNLENINNGIGKSTEIFKKVTSLVGLIKTFFGLI